MMCHQTILVFVLIQNVLVFVETWNIPLLVIKYYHFKNIKLIYAVELLYAYLWEFIKIFFFADTGRRLHSEHVSWLNANTTTLNILLFNNYDVGISYNSQYTVYNNIILPTHFHRIRYRHNARFRTNTFSVVSTGRLLVWNDVILVRCFSFRSLSHEKPWMLITRGLPSGSCRCQIS